MAHRPNVNAKRDDRYILGCSSLPSKCDWNLLHRLEGQAGLKYEMECGGMNVYREKYP
jgi:hypothetical protein